MRVWMPSTVEWGLNSNLEPLQLRSWQLNASASSVSASTLLMPWRMTGGDWQLMLDSAQIRDWIKRRAPLPKSLSVSSRRRLRDREARIKFEKGWGKFWMKYIGRMQPSCYRRMGHTLQARNSCASYVSKECLLTLSTHTCKPKFPAYPWNTLD